MFRGVTKRSCFMPRTSYPSIANGDDRRRFRLEAGGFSKKTARKGKIFWTCATKQATIGILTISQGRIDGSEALGLLGVEALRAKRSR